jgi:ceramide glucosyltransferase
MSALDVVTWICFVPVAGGSVFAVLSTLAVVRFMRRPMATPEGFAPPLTLLKPVYGLEQGLEERLQSACLQDYPDYQVIFCIQRPDDPALPVVRRLEAEFPDRAEVVVADVRAGPNGKVNNLLGAMPRVRHDILVISDSDVELRPDYLRTIVGPLVDSAIGGVCTLFKNAGAKSLYEKLELLTINADFIPSVIFTEESRAAVFCLGPSVALRRRTLERMGGLEALSDYLAEDFEIGRRVWANGERLALVPYVVDAMVDLDSWRAWWTHQVYWDQNTRAANPVGFFATILTRALPFALLLALLRALDPAGVAVLAGAVVVRLGTSAATLGRLGDREGLAALAWLPLRDVAGLLTWALAFTNRTVVWRGVRFEVRRDGRMIAIGPA